MIRLRQFYPRDLLPFVLAYLYDLLRQYYSTWSARALARWWNVKLGRGSLFMGIPYFRKHPTAKISIGNQCIFRSAEWSNSVGLNHRCFIDAARGAEIRIGARCGFSATIISAATTIHIGNDVLCGGNCTICDSDRHPTDMIGRRVNLAGKSKPVIIGDDVFLGMNTVVLKGVTIGNGTIVAANSVVVNSLPSHVIAAGCPARVIKDVS